MKLLILNLMILVSTNVFAQSDSADLFINMPVGTHFVVKKNVILKKQTSEMTFVNGRLYFNTEKLPNFGIKCVIYYEAVQYDRELVAGESFLRTMTSVKYAKSEYIKSEFREAHFYAFLEQENNPFSDLTVKISERTITCSKLTAVPPFDDVGVNLRVSDIQRALGNYFEIR